MWSSRLTVGSTCRRYCALIAIACNPVPSSFCLASASSPAVPYGPMLLIIKTAAHRMVQHERGLDVSICRQNMLVKSPNILPPVACVLRGHLRMEG